MFKKKYGGHCDRAKELFGGNPEIKVNEAVLVLFSCEIYPVICFFPGRQ